MMGCSQTNYTQALLTMKTQLLAPVRITRLVPN